MDDPMIERLILGPPKSGKSLYSERMVSASGKKNIIYVGTLPIEPYYFHTISEHQMRRPQGWSVLELSGAVDDDTYMLENAAQRCEAMLLDGLTFYVFRLFLLWGKVLQRDSNRLFRSAEMLVRSKSKIYAVDTDLIEALPDRVRGIVCRLHSILAQGASGIDHVSNGVARRLEVTQQNRLQLLRCSIERTILWR